MAYDNTLADRVTDWFTAHRTTFETKAMMGGLCFMVDGKMCVGVEKARLMVRLDPTVESEALAQPGCAPMDFTGRPMRGYFFVHPEGYETEKQLDYWLGLALAFNPKAKASKKQRANAPVTTADAISQYAARLTPAHAAICQQLRTEIDTTLPNATSKIWHGSPVWFVGDNPVTGYNVTAKKGVNLLFWSGQMFDEPLLKAVGKFKAAGIHFTDKSEINPKALRRWLKKCGTIIWDYKNLCKTS